MQNSHNPLLDLSVIWRSTYVFLVFFHLLSTQTLFAWLDFVSHHCLDDDVIMRRLSFSWKLKVCVDSPPPHPPPEVNIGFLSTSSSKSPTEEILFKLEARKSSNQWGLFIDHKKEFPRTAKLAWELTSLARVGFVWMVDSFIKILSFVVLHQFTFLKFWVWADLS